MGCRAITLLFCLEKAVDPRGKDEPLRDSEKELGGKIRMPELDFDLAISVPILASALVSRRLPAREERAVALHKW